MPAFIAGGVTLSTAAARRAVDLAPPQRRRVPQISAKLSTPAPLPPSSPNYDPALLLAKARAALQTAPSASTFLTLAERERRAGNFPAVRAALSSATTLEPNNSHLWRYWADFQLEIDSPSSARAIYKLALSSSRTPSSFLLYPFALLEARLGEIESARRLLYQAIALSPDEPDPYVTLASLEGREHARAILEYAVTRLGICPEAAAVHTARAQLEARDSVQLANGDQTARTCYSMARDSNPSDPMVWQRWAVFEGHRGRHNRARELFAMGMLVDSQSSSMWAAWAAVENRAGASETARNLFARAIEIDGQNVIAWAAWGNMERRLGNIEKARIVFWKAAETIKPGQKGLGSIYAGWAAVEAIRKDFPQARALFDKSIKAETSRKPQARNYFARAQMECAQGDLATAKRMYQASLRRDPYDPITLYTAGRLHVQLHEFDQARRCLANAERICPKDSRVLCEWAQLEYLHFAADGGVKKARSLYARARAIDSKCPDSAAAKLYSSAAAFERAHGSKAQARIYSSEATCRRKQSALA